MMNIEYMRTAKKSYMIVKKADFPHEQYELRMIRRNDISCLLPFQTILADGETEYWYDVSGMQSLKTRFLLESPDGKQIRFLLESLMEMKSAMESYLLDDANLCFSADMIYIERVPERIRFCYIPGLGSRPAAESEGQAPMDLKKLFEEILQHLNHADPAAVRMGYEMYERCVRSAFTMEDCAECLRIGELVGAGAPDLSVGEGAIRWKDAPVGIAEEKPDFENGELEFLLEEPEQKTGHRRKRKKETAPDRERRRPRERQQREEEELLFALRPPEPSERPEDCGKTELIRESDTEKGWELTYRGSGLESDFILSEFPFLVGTDARRAAGVLLARTVSRVHAKLYLEEERLYVEDFNSTNGTYLNQQLLPMNTPTELKEGDRIVFATEEYAVSRRRNVSPSH